jgi:hypothetical protein
MDPEIADRQEQPALEPQIDGREAHRAPEATRELGLDLPMEQASAGARPDQPARERPEKEDARQEQAQPASTHRGPPAEIPLTLADGPFPIGWLTARFPLELPAHEPSFRITTTSPMRVPGTHLASSRHFSCRGSPCADRLPKIAPTS